MDLLLARAILIHMTFTVTRLFLFFTEIEEWTDHAKRCTEEVKSNCVGAYNEDLMVMSDFMRYAKITLIFLGVLLDIICFKNRNYGHLVIYHEFFLQFVETLIPSAPLFDNQFYTIYSTFGLAFASFYCLKWKSILSATLIIIFQIFYSDLVYFRELTVARVLINSGGIVLFVCTLCLWNMLLLQFTEINRHVDEVNNQNIKLLNGMHEGLLILSKPKEVGALQKIKLCNHSALKLVNTFIGSLSNQDELAKHTEIITKASFFKVSFAD